MASPELLKAPGEHKKLPIRPIEDLGSNLMDPGAEAWAAMQESDRTAFVDKLSKSYFRYIAEYYDLANDCVDRYDSATKSLGLWKRGLIIGTGTVAIINLLAANSDISKWSLNILPIGAAIAALGLTIFTNLESSFKFSDRALAYRESRELFLDAARDFQRVWEVYVHPFRGQPSACVNGVELYRCLVASDRELRSKFKELTKTRDGGKGATSHGD